MSRSLEYQYTWSQLIFTCSLSKIDTLEKGVKSFVLFFLIGIHCMQGRTATTRLGVTRKEAQKRLHDTENLFRKNLQLKDVC